MLLKWIARLFGVSSANENPSVPVKMCSGAMERHCCLGASTILLCCKKCGATRHVNAYDFSLGRHDGDLCMEPVFEKHLPPPVKDGRTRRLAIDRVVDPNQTK